MYSVTKRISKVKQPRGGYVNKKALTATQFEDNISLNEKENIHASLVGLVVDYMTRFMMGTPKKEAFSISINGAMALDSWTEGKVELQNALALLKNIKGLDKDSIIAACKIVGYDVCYRAGIMGYKPVEEINPDKSTIENIITMINRSLVFWKKYGPITKDGFTFEGGYTDIISTGDGDYLTKDTLWDFKVSKTEPTTKHTLQILVYYLMGNHSIHTELFKDIKKLGLYNPRLNKMYTVEINSIPEEVMNEVSHKIIGY
ncbi:hypothetical protein FP435_00460 (plasmid) [Lactobacillus sp. PV037]|uniref:hypothetical protein n=1 Tax=unclassified Lactobacillus TaxID=2620435 RepID=UPI002240D43A|nr:MULTISPECIES: hypothetical protein [unclassified Lactobacillus]QNQ82909.1 hypothetical protein FP433_07355 [Lactobacillus sp. PV012]QNQ83014.1 hypothetical protein FP435_00460 [Lactobacillus sp. PV037]